MTGSGDGVSRNEAKLLAGARSVNHRTEQGQGFVGHPSLACADIDGRSHVVIAGGGSERAVHVRDLTDGTERAVLRCGTGGVRALDCTVIDGSPHVVMCGAGVEVWDLARGVRRAVLTGHRSKAGRVSCLWVDGRPMAFTTGDDSTVRLWDLQPNELVETITLPLAGWNVAAAGSRLVVTMSDEVAVFAQESEQEPE